MTNYWPEGWLVNTAQNHSFCQNISGLREALHSQTILEARACVCTPEHDLVVDLDSAKEKSPAVKVLSGSVTAPPATLRCFPVSINRSALLSNPSSKIRMAPLPLFCPAALHNRDA